MKLLGRMNEMNSLDKSFQLLYQCLEMARLTCYMQGVIQLRQAKSLPRIKQEILHISRIATTKCIHEEKFSTGEAQHIQTLLAQMHQTIAIGSRKTLVKAEVGQWGYGNIEFGLRETLGDALVQQMIQPKYHHSQVVAHTIAQHFNIASRLRKILQIELAFARAIIIFPRYKGIGCIGHNHTDLSVDMLQHINLLKRVLQIGRQGLLWIYSIRLIGKSIVGLRIMYSKTKSIRTQTDG